MQQWEEQRLIREIDADLMRQIDDTLVEISKPQPTGNPVRMPCPEGLDPAKWATLDRRTRRQLRRHHDKLQRKAGS